MGAVIAGSALIVTAFVGAFASKHSTVLVALEEPSREAPSNPARPSSLLKSSAGRTLAPFAGLAASPAVPTVWSEDPNTLDASARARFAKGDYDGATADFRRADNLKPNDPNILDGLGRALSAKGDKDEAIKVFRRAHELRPNDTNILDGLARNQLARGDYDGAIANFRLAHKLNGDDHNIFDGLIHALSIKGGDEANREIVALSAR